MIAAAAQWPRAMRPRSLGVDDRQFAGPVTLDVPQMLGHQLFGEVAIAVADRVEDGTVFKRSRFELPMFR
jgi:hypothetical protein